MPQPETPEGSCRTSQALKSRACAATRGKSSSATGPDQRSQRCLPRPRELSSPAPAQRSEANRLHPQAPPASGARVVMSNIASSQVLRLCLHQIQQKLNQQAQLTKWGQTCSPELPTVCSVPGKSSGSQVPRLRFRSSKCEPNKPSRQNGAGPCARRFRMTAVQQTPSN